jgi:hypothetical protein
VKPCSSNTSLSNSLVLDQSFIELVVFAIELKKEERALRPRVSTPK